MQKNKAVNVVLGAGSIGQAIVRRISAGKHVLLADIRQENAEAAVAYWFGELAPKLSE